MSSHIQTALINQLQSQIKQHTAYETAKLYLDLRHRIDQHTLINKHFTEREQNVSRYILDSYNKRNEIIKINQLRFNLRIDERMELMFNKNTPYFTKYESPDVDDIQDRMFADMNDFLFFKNAYTSTNVYANSDNTYFYYLVLLSVIALVFKF
ncbi:hypothetical protein PBCVAN69C_448L [Paramecium bursaria Chlorella virus AN69C]|uniref:Uncharacterized protein n=1 Tax=Paramecium bursaria Chlorella virus IL3A TaxID=46019 RepID=M1HPV4_PBCVI|nr:hypothetical protein PBCVAN69C_448L [Paramecium bursaria Chlorella virus AN69C]AGE53907.1 hypothetical protein PBCVIL3A_442L [Paramecium bursaria Chlorella virus IL3A]AGE57336.1 hypothetical protein PBCVNEJV4_446L [Paramecium bursaria Chlorella virus NE-JV-4]